MASEQIKIGPSNKSFIVKHTLPTMDKISNLSQVTVVNFKHAKVGKSFIPSVPVNYICSKQKKAGKSFIPRFAVIYSKHDKNGKPSISHVNSITYFNLEKDNHCNLVKGRRSYIPRIKAAKKVEPLFYSTQEKTQQKNVETPTSLFGNSKIPVPTSTKKANVSVLNSAKKADGRIRTSALDTAKKGNACVSIQDDQVRVLTFNAIRKNDGQADVLTYNVIKKDPSRISTLTSIKKSLIPVHKLTYTLFKKRVDPLQPSTLTTLTSAKKDVLARTSTFTSNKKANDIMRISLKNKHTTLQKSVNKPEASTTTSIIKPELSSISLLYKAEKDLSNIKHQAEENSDSVPSLFGNVFKTIIRFGKDLFSKLT